MVLLISFSFWYLFISFNVNNNKKLKFFLRVMKNEILCFYVKPETDREWEREEIWGSTVGQNRSISKLAARSILWILFATLFFIKFITFSVFDVVLFVLLLFPEVSRGLFGPGNICADVGFEIICCWGKNYTIFGVVTYKR